MKNCSFPGCIRKFYGNDLCRGHYDQQRVRGWLTPLRAHVPKTTSRVERFAALTIPEPNTGCLLWLGATSQTSGYGKFGDGAGKTASAHRWAWEQANGPIPDGLHVCHRCDTRLCVNADHMFLGTQVDNMQDALAKGRLGQVSRLSEVDLSDIMALDAQGVSGRDIARTFRVSPAYICNILRGKARPRRPRAA